MVANTSVRFNLPFNLGLPDSAPHDLSDPRVAALLEQVYNAFQQLQMALHVYVGIGQQLQSLWPNLRYDQTLHLFSPNRLYAVASETIAYGNAVNVFNNAGVLTVRNANATDNTKPTHGFCTTTGGIAAAAFGECILQCGIVLNLAGLVLGTRYFLSTTNGLITSVAPVALGNVEQALGIALDSTALFFNFGYAFVQH